MFDLFSEVAKRVIYFARYEAVQAGFDEIESEHLLLGILREGYVPFIETLAAHGITPERVRQSIEARTQTGQPSSVFDIPLSEESKRILKAAVSESVKRSHPVVDTDHLLLGMLRQEECLAAVVLNELGLKASSKVSARLTQRWNDPVWRRQELVERLGVEKAFQEPSIRERLSDATCQEVEELLTQIRDAEDAAFARQKDVNEFGLLWVEALALRERAQRLLMD